MNQQQGYNQQQGGNLTFGNMQFPPQVQNQQNNGAPPFPMNAPIPPFNQNNMAPFNNNMQNAPPFNNNMGGNVPPFNNNNNQGNNAFMNMKKPPTGQYGQQNNINTFNNPQMGQGNFQNNPQGQNAQNNNMNGNNMNNNNPNFPSQFNQQPNPQPTAQFGNNGQQPPIPPFNMAFNNNMNNNNNNNNMMNGNAGFKPNGLNQGNQNNNVPPFNNNNNGVPQIGVSPQQQQGGLGQINNMNANNNNFNQQQTNLNGQQPFKPNNQVPPQDQNKQQVGGAGTPVNGFNPFPIQSNFNAGNFQQQPIPPFLQLQNNALGQQGNNTAVANKSDASTSLQQNAGQGVQRFPSQPPFPPTGAGGQQLTSNFPIPNQQNFGAQVGGIPGFNQQQQQPQAQQIPQAGNTIQPPFGQKPPSNQQLQTNLNQPQNPNLSNQNKPIQSVSDDKQKQIENHQALINQATSLNNQNQAQPPKPQQPTIQGNQGAQNNNNQQSANPFNKTQVAQNQNTNLMNAGQQQQIPPPTFNHQQIFQNITQQQPQPQQQQQKQPSGNNFGGQQQQPVSALKIEPKPEIVVPKQQPQNSVFPLYHFDHSYDTMIPPNKFPKCSKKTYRLQCGHEVCLESMRAFLEKKGFNQDKFYSDRTYPSFAILCPFYTAPPSKNEDYNEDYQYDGVYQQCNQKLTPEDFDIFRNINIFDNYEFLE